MPKRHFYLTFLLILFGTIIAPAAIAEPAKISPKPHQEPRIQPHALELLKAMSMRLTGAETLSFTAITSYESPSRIGPPLLYTSKAEVTLQRPNKLRIIVSGDGPASEFYYDGKTMMVFAPAENMVAIANAPATIDSTLKLAYDSSATYFPFSDVIAENPFKLLGDDLIRAFFVGQSKVVGNTTTDIIAIENPWVFEQIWIGQQDKLPRMMRAVFRSDPLRLRHQIEFSNWKLNGRVDSSTFTSPAARAAKPVPFASPKPVSEKTQKTSQGKTIPGGNS